ncbi:MAG: hypothetical protein VB948_14000 [Pseudomonadales bacterium]
MPEISIQNQCATLTDLVDCESFGEPIGDLPKQTDSGFSMPEIRLAVPGNVNLAPSRSIWTSPSSATF